MFQINYESLTYIAQILPLEAFFDVISSKHFQASKLILTVEKCEENYCSDCKRNRATQLNKI